MRRDGPGVRARPALTSTRTTSSGPLITAVARDTGIWTDSDVPVPWWSFAKTVLATAALVLVEAGRLQLDEPVAGKPYTLRHLLGHRAGLRCYGTLRAYHEAVASGEPPWPVTELLRRVDAGTLDYEPGRGWGYSNVGYLLVRHLVEAAAGLSIDNALEELVFRPLDVRGITLARTPADLDATAWGNARRYYPEWVYHGLLVGPAGSAALFLHRLLAGQLLPPDLLLAMQGAHQVDGSFPGRPWTIAAYGLGLMVGQGDPPNQYLGHTGGGPGSTSAVYQRAGAPIDCRCTAAAFAPIDDPGIVERHVMALACNGSPHEAS